MLRLGMGRSLRGTAVQALSARCLRVRFRAVPRKLGSRPPTGFSATSGMNDVCPMLLRSRRQTRHGMLGSVPDRVRAARPFYLKTAMAGMLLVFQHCLQFCPPRVRAEEVAVCGQVRSAWSDRRWCWTPETVDDSGAWSRLRKIHLPRTSTNWADGTEHRCLFLAANGLQSSDCLWLAAACCAASARQPVASYQRRACSQGRSDTPANGSRSRPLPHRSVVVMLSMLWAPLSPADGARKGINGHRLPPSPARPHRRQQGGAESKRRLCIRRRAAPHRLPRVRDASSGRFELLRHRGPHLLLARRLLANHRHDVVLAHPLSSRGGFDQSCDVSWCGCAICVLLLVQLFIARMPTR